jgi:hypothetical protein
MKSASHQNLKKKKNLLQIQNFHFQNDQSVELVYTTVTLDTHRKIKWVAWKKRNFKKIKVIIQIYVHKEGANHSRQAQICVNKHNKFSQKTG